MRLVPGSVGNEDAELGEGEQREGTRRRIRVISLTQLVGLPEG